MIKENASCILLYGILFICQYYSTNANPLKKDIIDEIKTVIVKPEIYPDFDNFVYEPEYVYEDLPCQYDCENLEKRSNKRHIDDSTNDAVSDINQSPSSFYKYHNFLRSNKKTKKWDQFISRGWGAGGMPFNVLYTPNSHQQKILRSVPDKVLIAPVNVYPSIGEPMALTAPQPQQQSSYNLMQDETNSKKPGMKITSKQTPSRRHYSIIPQLFVSYGWGPMGK